MPIFFRGCCWTAAVGGAHSYAEAGWHLANAIGNGSQEPYDVEPEEWAAQMEVLHEMLALEDDAGICRILRH